MSPRSMPCHFWRSFARLAMIVAFTSQVFGSRATVLHNFNPNAVGSYPLANVIADAAGDLYGTTESGGALGFGTVFKMTPGPHGKWKEEVLYSFAGGADGSAPYTGLLFDQSGNLYGTTAYGGSTNCGSQGCGTVFEILPVGHGKWSHKVIHTFQGGASDGESPMSNLAMDASGNLYGTTQSGGSSQGYGDGIVFELTPASGGQWNESLLYVFPGSSDAGRPAGFVLDPAGNIYGIAGGGRNNDGVVYELTPNSQGGWTFNDLHDFDGLDGKYPTGGLLRDASGNLYGTTYSGPGEGCLGYGGCGVVFELSPQGGGQWSLQDLYVFEGGPDGADPNGSLIEDADGNLYGTTEEGGNLNGTDCYECGTVFEVSPGSGNTWKERVLLRFAAPVPQYQANSQFGCIPQSGLLLDHNNNLIGTAPSCGKGYYDGTVFQLVRGKHEKWGPVVMFDFGAGLDGANPGSGLVAGGPGTYYGTTQYGGNGPCGGCGAVFELRKSGKGWKEKAIFSLSNTNAFGVSPSGVTLDEKGNLYGTTSFGGLECSLNNSGCGSVFKVDRLKRGWMGETLYQFDGGTGGGQPAAGVIVDSSGNIYGTTAYGGSCQTQNSGCGVVYALMRGADRWTEKVLYTFQGGSDGYYPAGLLLLDSAGNLYGTAESGGTGSCGIVFELSPGFGDTWDETILHTFSGRQGDGCTPLGNLAFDTEGHLFGITTYGGDYDCGYYGSGCGVVFELSPKSDGSWTGKSILIFEGRDGANPTGGLSFDSAGNLYVAASTGGRSKFGNVVKLNRDESGKWRKFVLHDFAGADGESPNAPVVVNESGHVLGTSNQGGSLGLGTIFEIVPGAEEDDSVDGIVVRRPELTPRPPNLPGISPPRPLLAITSSGGGQ